jgi:hypothetical protein
LGFLAEQNADGSCTLTDRNKTHPTPDGGALTITLECGGQTSAGTAWIYSNVPDDPNLGPSVQFSVEGLPLTCDNAG